MLSTSLGLPLRAAPAPRRASSLRRATTCAASRETLPASDENALPAALGSEPVMETASSKTMQPASFLAGVLFSAMLLVRRAGLRSAWREWTRYASSHELVCGTRGQLCIALYPTALYLTPTSRAPAGLALCLDCGLRRGAGGRAAPDRGVRARQVSEQRGGRSWQGCLREGGGAPPCVPWSYLI